MNFDVILRVGTRLILPFMLLFALYVQFHGDYGPGGGFQAGVIAAGMVILLTVTCGIDLAQRIAPPGLVRAHGAARRVDLCRHRRYRHVAAARISSTTRCYRTTRSMDTSSVS